MSRKQRLIGVYVIVNIISKDFYVGSTFDRRGIRHRLRTHFIQLQQGNHGNPFLQNSYNKYGEEAFFGLPLEFVEMSENVVEREKYWVEALKPQFNLIQVQDNDWYTTPEFKKAVSDGVKKRFAEDPEYRRKTGEATSRRRHSKETKDRMSESHKGDISVERAKRGWETRKKNGNGSISEEQRQKIGDKNRNNKNISEATKKRWAEYRLKKQQQNDQSTTDL